MTANNDLPDYTARVVSRRTVSAHMVRVTVGNIRARADALPLSYDGPPDEFFALWVPVKGGPAVHRYYTARAWRPETNELDIELLLHGHGPATEWAASAAPGDEVGFDYPRGHYRPPADAVWLAVCGDATALPAIARILGERTQHAISPPMRVVVAVDDIADQIDLPLRPGDQLSWVKPAELVAATRSLTEAETPGYLWFSGEASDMRAVRHTLRRELHWPNERWMTMGYWRRDQERWHAKFDAAGDEFRRQLEQVWTSADDAETQLDRAEELLAEKGLL